MDSRVQFVADEEMNVRILGQRMCAVTICAILFCPVVVGAMPIPQFNKMASSDESQYVTLLVKGSVDGLTARGNKRDADKLFDLFDKGSGGDQLINNLKLLTAADKQNAADPNNKQPPYEVEQAFALTLKQNGIIVPLKFLMSINKDFKPSATTTPHK